MKIRKAFVAFTVCALCSLNIANIFSPDRVKAETQIENSDNLSACRKLVVGTYFILYKDLPTRSLLTFTQDGNFFAIDSIQGGIEGLVTPFSDAHGSWKCNGNQEVSAITLSFTYQTTEAAGRINRAEFHLKFNSKTETVEGTVTIRFFDLTANPLQDTTPPVATYIFSGQRVTAD